MDEPWQVNLAAVLCRHQAQIYFPRPVEVWRSPQAGTVGGSISPPALPINTFAALKRRTSDLREPPRDAAE